MFEAFLICLAVVWLAFASACDFRKREIPDWISFSLIAITLAYRAFYSITNWSDFFTPGLIGFAIFYVLGEGIYRIGFGGGDAKLLAALGCILPFSQSFWENIEILSVFFISLMIIGAFYSLGFSLFVAVKNKKRFLLAFRHETSKQKKIILGAGVVFLLSLVMVYLDFIFLMLSGLILISPLILIYSKAIEETMVRSVYTSRLVPGDWLYENVKVGSRIVKPKITGLDEKELKILKNYKGKVKVKDGVPFTISFLFAFLLVLWLRHSDWSFFNYYFGFF